MSIVIGTQGVKEKKYRIYKVSGNSKTSLVYGACKGALLQLAIVMIKYILCDHRQVLSVEQIPLSFYFIDTVVFIYIKGCSETLRSLCETRYCRKSKYYYAILRIKPNFQLPGCYQLRELYPGE